MNWDDLRYFLAIARTNSLSAAGRHLKVSQPTVSRRLMAMEERFGVKLFVRTKSGFELSVAGAEVFDAVQNVEEDINSIDRRMSGQDQRLKGPLRITCTEVLANLYLTPHLSRFVAEHPEIELSVICTFKYLSLSRREADVAIRMTHQPPDTLIGRRLADTAMCVYAALDTHLPEQGTGNGGGWDWIGWQDESYNRMLITTPFPKARIKHRVDDLQTMRTMARAGLGVAVLPCYMADRDAGLRRVTEQPMTKNVPDLWVLSHPDVRRVVRIRIFVDFITKAVLADRDLFEGRRPQGVS
jgi:DNA-binding transcriptional LysR family regulator